MNGVGSAGQRAQGARLRASPACGGRKADLVLANLLERALYDLAPAFARNMSRRAAGRSCPASPKPRRDAIEARYPSLGFAMEKRIHSRWMDDLGDSPSQRAHCPRLIASEALSLQRPAMYQIFDDVSSPAASGERVKALQRELKSRKLKGFLVPHSDEHQDEFLAPPAERLAWLTGFTGSAGVAIVLEKAAALFVDGRYTCKRARRPTPTLFEVLQTPDAKASSWIAEKLGKGAAIGYDPALHTIKEIERLTETLGQVGHQAHSRRYQSRSIVSGRTGRSRRRAEIVPHGRRICGQERPRQDPRRAGAAQGRERRRRAADHARFDRLAVQHQGRRYQAHAGRARFRHRAGERQADALHRSRQGRRQRQGRACASLSISPSRPR